MDEKKKIIWKKRTINAKWKRYLTPEQQADLFARTNLAIWQNDSMIKRCIWCKIDKSDQEYYKLSYGEWVVNLCKECLLKEDNQMRPEDRHSENMVKLREKMLTTYKLSDYIRIYNTK